MEFKDLAAVSGKGGLFKVVSPTKSGIILETLDQQKKKLVISSQVTKVSILAEISIYTTNEEGSKALEEILKLIHNEFNGDIGVTKTSDPDELKSFFRHILPEYDEDRVYVSDIKKVVNWYTIVLNQVPELLEGSKEDQTMEPLIEDAEVIDDEKVAEEPKNGTQETGDSGSTDQ